MTRHLNFTNLSSLTVFDSVDSLKPLKLPRITESITAVVCIEGAVKVEFDEKCLVMPKSSIMVLAPGHLLRSYEPSSDFKGFAINATLNYIEQMLPIMSRIIVCYKAFESDPILTLRSEDIQQLILYREILHNKLISPDSQYKQWIINSICQAITTEIFTFYFKELEHKENVPNIKHTRSEEIFYKFITLVEDNYKKVRSISEYASKLCVSNKYLSALVSDVSGRTASSWIDSYVILEAKRLLSSSDMTVLQISEELSFPNQSFFGKYFKHHTGLSPLQYKKQQLERVQ